MNKIRDGDLYKIMDIHGVSFEIRYGYYEEFERDHHDPVPIYPDLATEPRYTPYGRPLVTAMQNACDSFEGADPELGCYGCKYYKEENDLIGTCQNEKRRKTT